MLKKNTMYYKIYMMLAFYSFFIMLFCTKSSPLYVLNDWYDANAYYTMGKGLVNGMVPYRDLFDHKGPFLYFIYAIGYLISNNSFKGIFILQVVAMSIILIYSFKIAKIYTSNNKASFIISILMPVSILTEGFYVYGNNYGGGSPDEFVVPIFILVLYLIVKLLKCDVLFDKKVYITFFIIGTLGSLIFQLKFTDLSLVIGLVAPTFIYLLVKKTLTFIKSFLLFCSGFILGLTPYFIYSTATGSLKDFLRVYIKFNKIYGSIEGKNLIYSLAVASKNAVSIMLDRNMLIFIIISFGLLYFLYSYKDKFILNLSIILSYALTFLSLSVVPYNYVYVTIISFSLFGYIFLYEVFSKLGCQKDINHVNRNQYNIGIYITSLLIIFCFTVSNNYLVAADLNRITQRRVKVSCQQQVADIINANKNEDSSLLEVLSLDSGFYTVSGITPKSKYFYIPNISFDRYPYVYVGQYEDVKSKVNEYVISSFEANYNEEIEAEPINAQNYGAKIGNAISDNYSLIKTIEGTYLQEKRTFYLYRRVD